MMTVFLGVCLLAAALPQTVPQNPERVREIAGWLAEEPSPCGLRLDDRAFWSAYGKCGSGARVLREARKILKNPIPECPDELYLEFTRTGNRTHYQKPYYARTSNLQKLIVAECVENAGNFLPKIAEYLDTIAAERSWSMPAHDRSLSSFNGTKLTIDLGSAHRSTVVAYALALFRGKLPDATAARARAELDRRVFNVYLTKAAKPETSGDGWFFGHNNWNPVCHASVLMAALAVIEDRTERAKFIEGEERGIPYYLDGFAEDGYCTEGVGYWNYGFEHHLYGALAVRRATGGKVDFLKDPKNRKVMAYSNGIRLTDTLAPQFADGGGFPDRNVCALGCLVWPEFASKSTEEAKSAGGGGLYRMQFLFGAKRLETENIPEHPPLGIRDWFPSAQVLLARPRPSGRFAIAVKGGHNAELHNHNDVGSYMIAFDGKRLSGDPGGEVYTARTFSKRRYESNILNSYGHPVPVVNGTLQSTGAEARAEVVSTSFSDEGDILVLELKAAYAVPTLKSLRRTVALDRVHDRIAIVDRAEFTEPGTLSVPVVALRGAENAAVSVASTCTVEAESAEETLENPGKADVLRRALTAKAPSAVQEIRTVFSLKDNEKTGEQGK